MKREKADYKDRKIDPAHTLHLYKVEVISNIGNTPLYVIIKDVSNTAKWYAKTVFAVRDQSAVI